MQEEVGKGLRWNTKDGVTINHRATRTLADHRHSSLSTSHLLRLQLGGVQSRKWSHVSVVTSHICGGSIPLVFWRSKVLYSLDVLQVKSKTAPENVAVCVWVNSGSRGVVVKALLFGLMDSGPWIRTFLSLKMIDYLFCIIWDDLKILVCAPTHSYMQIYPQ